jgi:hypothetical protein
MTTDDELLTHLTPNSSHVRAFVYDPKARTMSVHFHNGNVYVHHEVHSGELEVIKKAFSPGRYYHAGFKRKYPKVDKQTPEDLKKTK